MFQMKAIFLILAIAFASVYCEGESSSSSSEEVSWNGLSQIVNSKLNITIINDIINLVNKTKEQCPDIEDKIDDAIDQVATCADAVDSSTDTFCSLIRKNFATCVEPVRKVVTDCLPEESKGLTSMAVKIIVAVIDQGCNSTVEEIIELFNPCQTEEEFTTFEPCNKIKDAFLDSKGKLPSKSLVCKVFPKVKQCVKSHEEASCKNPVTKRSVMQFYDAIDAATTEECQDINETK